MLASRSEAAEGGNRYGAGSVRSMEAFRAHVDVDFAACVVGARAKLGGLPPAAFVALD
jgi:hypothetical protein